MDKRVIVGDLAVAALTKFAKWEEWVSLLLGLWVIVRAWGEIAGPGPFDRILGTLCVEAV